MPAEAAPTAPSPPGGAAAATALPPGEAIPAVAAAVASAGGQGGAGTSQGPAPTPSPSERGRGGFDIYGLLLEPPTPYGYLVEVVSFYVTVGINVRLCGILALRGDWAAVGNLAGFLAFPGLLCAAHQYVILMFNKGLTRKQRLFEAALTALQLHRAAEAIRYLRGVTPNWYLNSVNKHIWLSVSKTPVLVNSLYVLLHMRAGEAIPPALALSIVVLLLSCPLTARIDHLSSGEPANFQKYRFWDVESRPVLSVVLASVIDWAQISYRMVLFSLVTVFAGPWKALALMAGHCFINRLVSRDIFVFMLPGGAVNRPLFEPVQCIAQIIHDFGWLEPLPAYSGHNRLLLEIRFAQALVGAWMIGESWYRRAELHPLFWPLLAYGLGNAVVFFALYPFVTGYLCYLWRDRLEASNTVARRFLFKKMGFQPLPKDEVV